MQLRNRLKGSRPKRLLAIAGVTAATIVLAGCSGATGASSSTAPLKIGISLSLTGDFSDSGKAAERGYELWAAQANKAGGILGRKVQLTIHDDASSPDQVVSNYTNLITQDRVDLVFGPYSSLLTVPASRVASRYHYAFIESAGGGPSVFAQKLNNLFFVQPAPTTQGGDVFADYILSLPSAERPKTAAYAKLDDPFSAPIADNIKKRFEAAGIKTVYNQTYPAETADMTPIVSGIAAANPDVVVGGTQEADAFAQMKAMIQLKFSPKWLFEANGANSPGDFPAAVGAANTEGVFSSADWYADSPNPSSKKFISDYLATYGGTAQKIDPTSAEAYSAGMLVQAVAAKTGKVDNATIIKTLHSGTWSTLVGDLKWDASGAPQGAYQLIQWINGTLTTVYPAKGAQHSPVAPKPNWAG
ncbi:amino acid ABC transporter substrate-binding protein [Diaminobutyricibacter tongyongensis]|uniref:Amino acid ABC transporter substrate-binding protein n=1 Tax=Leifsonia tongyongensis TaxID=1268043 RepID=A0A6L9XUJ9_9MICO|nr:amino acid ABC transporter substrate-binding protein [Diaminobutyricibacter tongyongensis]NEN05070.1 amino acid ABC transporter substrate-binding protein [Diaminobutyricibacter tongyongensis]